MSAVATDWNNNFTPTKYVSDITISGANGEITITYDTNEIPQLNSGNLVVLTPSINGSDLPTAAAAGTAGNIDWACAGADGNTATNRGLPVTTGTVLARYLPSECK
ncbi:MAG: hypothetical protein KatS3mg121_1444 [Gammaproteobacteria bacterium]|nr:MAG: hypothetical protein KatS3mg121_1444 [Gammaproteobacteria bacterium]